MNKHKPDKTCWNQQANTSPMDFDYDQDYIGHPNDEIEAIDMDDNVGAGHHIKMSATNIIKDGQMKEVEEIIEEIQEIWRGTGE